MQIDKPGGIWRPYLELVRPPALFTSAADSLAGWAWVISLLSFTNETKVINTNSLLISEFIGVTLLLISISALIYAAGMITNDIFDYQEDLKDRPFRPLPSERVSRSIAWSLAIGFQTTALLLTCVLVWSLGLQTYLPLWLSFFTIMMTYCYNKVFKQTLVAPIFMGLCRLGNFWIGASLIFIFIGFNDPIIQTFIQLPLLTSMGTLLYVTSLTSLSRYEVKGGKGARYWALCLLILSSHPLWWLWADMLMPQSALHHLLIYIVTAVNTFWLALQLKKLILKDVTALQVQKAVGSGIRGVALCNISLCIAFHSWFLATVIMIMTLSAKKVAQWFYAT